MRFAAEHRTRGQVAPKPQGRPSGQFGKLAPHISFLLDIVSLEPDITLKELTSALHETRGVQVQLSSLHRALERARLSYKKGLIAIERDRPALRQARPDWITRRQPRMRQEASAPHQELSTEPARSSFPQRQLWIAHRQPFMAHMLERIGFLDETWLKTNMAKTTGRAPRGQRLVDYAPFGHWRTQTFDRAVFGDKGYVSDKRKRAARADGVFWGVKDKRKQGRVLSATQKKRNRRHGAVRAKVEHAFAS